MSRQTDATAELIAIKRLLILSLVKSGMTQNQIAAALEIDRSLVSKMFPTGTLKSLSRGGLADE